GRPSGEPAVTQPHDVWITGVGVATPLGHTYAALADALLAGRPGVRTVTAFDVSNHPSQIAGTLGPVPCPPGWDERAFAALDRFEQAALWCCAGALRDAGWWERRAEVRVGLVLGVGAEWLIRWEAAAAGGAAVDAEPLVVKT